MRGQIDIKEENVMGKFDPNQLSLDLDFKQTIATTAKAIQKSLAPKTTAFLRHNDIGVCHVISGTIKAAIQASGMSRDELVDRINGYFCRTTAGASADPPECLRPLTKAQMDNYLSNPAKYRLPAYYLYAICHVLDTLEPIKGIAASMGGEVISKEDSLLLSWAKLQRAMEAGKAMEKELKKKLVN